jgi:hypothetical protein
MNNYILTLMEICKEPLEKANQIGYDGPLVRQCSELLLLIFQKR